jgi:hypothetical protein
MAVIKVYKEPLTYSVKVCKCQMQFRINVLITLLYYAYIRHSDFRHKVFEKVAIKYGEIKTMTLLHIVGENNYNILTHTLRIRFTCLI